MDQYAAHQSMGYLTGIFCYNARVTKGIEIRIYLKVMRNSEETSK